MKINGVIWLRNVIDKILWKHHVTTDEVEEVFSRSAHHRFLEKGNVEGTCTRLWAGPKLAVT
jgi:hypothetical protein